jgi:uncharacterized membrane protein YfcA
LAPLQLTLVVLAAMIAGVMNSVAGAGTLVTFPALIAAGIPAVDANATSTMALVPGAMGSMWGYRKQLEGSRLWALGFAFPSLLGGALGAWLLLVTPPDRFKALVPYLVLGATFLFLVQRPTMRWLRRHQSAGGREPRAESGFYDGDPTRDIALTSTKPPLSVLGYQFAVSVYGGYFGAGVGILMLAALGFMGLGNIHRMNGLKNWGGLCMNGVAAFMFAFTKLVHWPIALAMAAGAVTGGYIGSRTAQRLPQTLVRGAIIGIGLVSGVLMLWSR